MKNFTLFIASMLFSIVMVAQTDSDNDLSKGVINYNIDTPKNIIKGASSCFELPSPVNNNVSNCDAGATPVNVDILQKYAKLIITDSMDTTYVNNSSFIYGLPIIDTTFNAHVYPGSDIVISEIGFGNPDYIEIQNVSNSTIHTKDWFVVISNSYTNINLTNSITWMLPDTILPGEVLFKDDNSASSQYWGSNIFFSESIGDNQWVMIIDNCGNIVDAYFHGWSKANINAMSIAVNSVTITPNTEWLGNGTDNSIGIQSVDRKGSSDNQTASDFDLYTATGTESAGTQNTVITYPFTDITEIEVPIGIINGNKGLMFNIVAKEDIQIESFSPYLTYNSGDTVKVYYIDGSYLPEMNSLTNWNYIGYNEFLYSATDSITNLSLGNIFIAAGDTVGIYIDTDNKVTYSTGDTIKTDDFIEVIHGHGMSTIGGTPFSPRHYTGKVHYNIGRNLTNNTAVIDITNKESLNITEGFITDNTCTGTSLGSVDSLTIMQGTFLDEGAYSHDFSSTYMTRGYAFIAPLDIIIDSLRVPDMAVSGEVQNIQVVKFTTNVGSAFTTLYYGNNLSAGNWIPVNLDINQGDIIGILGARGTATMHNAYGPTASYSTAIGGLAVDLYRIIYDSNLNTTEALTGDIGIEAHKISQIDMRYSYVPSTGVTYAWDNSETTMLIDSLLSGTYNLIATNAYGCDDNISLTINDLNPNPVVDLGLDTTLCADENITLDAGAGFSSYDWSTGNTGNTELVDTNNIGIGAFTYSVQVEDANGCLGFDTVLVTFEICTEIESYNNVEVNLYPNPNNGNFNVDLSSLIGETTIIISNVSGQVIKEIKSENSATTITVGLSNFESGIYFISITNDEYRNTVKMLIK